MPTVPAIDLLLTPTKRLWWLLAYLFTALGLLALAVLGLWALWLFQVEPRDIREWLAGLDRASLLEVRGVVGLTLLSMLALGAKAFRWMAGTIHRAIGRWMTREI